MYIFLRRTMCRISYPARISVFRRMNWLLRYIDKVTGENRIPGLRLSMICKYPHVYTDISFTVHDKELLSLLKVALENDPLIAKKVWLGTDVYVNSIAKSGRAYSVDTRAFPGREFFDQTAIVNAREYLSNKFNPV